MFFKDIQAQDGDIVYLCEYIPHSRTRYRDKRSEDFVLAYKDKEMAAIQYACQQIAPQLGNDIALAAVPSSKCISNGSSASHELIRALVNQLPDNHLIDAGSCLIRTTDIPAQHMAKGKRDPLTLLRSLGVKNSNLIRDKDVIVIDDITTSGNSFITARDLLLKHGARHVVGLAIGKTITHENTISGFIFSVDSLLSNPTDISSLKQFVLKIKSTITMNHIAFITSFHSIVNEIPDIDFIMDKNKSEDVTRLYAGVKQSIQTYEPCIIVYGDTERELAAAKQLGMTTVMVSKESVRSKADHIIKPWENALSKDILERMAVIRREL